MKKAVVRGISDHDIIVPVSDIPNVCGTVWYNGKDWIHCFAYNNEKVKVVEIIK